MVGSRCQGVLIGLLFVLGVMSPNAAEQALAVSLDAIVSEGWCGTGVNQTALVVDFSTGDGHADSFGFGYNYGTTVGETTMVYDVMYALKTRPGSAFNFIATDYSSYGWGYLINSISYTKNGVTYTDNYRSGEDDPIAYWYLWTSGDAGRNWTQSLNGASFTSLGNGDIAGYVAAVPDEYVNWTSNTPPETPTAAPEPSIIVLVLSGGLTLLGWRFWRRRR
jgi:hypothetical protein